MKAFICWVILVTLITAGCAKDELGTDKNPHVIVWKLNSDANKITYSVDGQPVGVGVTGIKNVLSFLNSCKLGTTLRIEASRSDWVDLSERTGATDPLAMEAFRVQDLGEFNATFYGIANRLKLRFTLKNLNK